MEYQAPTGDAAPVLRHAVLDTGTVIDMKTAKVIYSVARTTVRTISRLAARTGTTLLIVAFVSIFV